MNIEEQFLEIYNSEGLNDIPLFIEKHEKLYDLICEKYHGLYNICRALNIKPPFARKRPKEEIIKELYRLYNKFGYVSKPMMEKYSYINRKVVQRIFGSFANMYEELNIKRHPSGRVATQEELIKEFLRIYNLYGDISYNVLDQEAKYSSTCYYERFNGINNLKKSLGIEIKPHKCDESANYTIKKFEIYLNEVAEKEKTFSWLRNPTTNQKLRIDAYFPEHNIALEYNGPQHYKTDTMYIKTQEELEYRQYLDKLKISILAAHGIPTITVHYKDKITDEYIKNAIDITKIETRPVS